MTEAINSMAFVSWQLQLRFSSHLYRYRRLRARQRLSSRRPSAFGPASFFRVKWSCDERGPAQLAIVLTGCPLESPEFHRIPRLSLSDLHLKWQVLIFFFIFKILLVGIKGNIYILKSIMLVSGDWRDDGFFFTISLDVSVHARPIRLPPLLESIFTRGMGFLVNRI